MDWTTMRWVSGALRKLGHDLNNALLPVFGSADILRLRHTGPLPTADLDRLSTRLLAVRETITLATAGTLRQRHPEPPTLRTIHSDLAGEALCASVGLRWRCELPQDGGLPGLNGHEAHLLIACLVRNALQAHLDDRATSQDEPRRRQICVHISETEDGRVIVDVCDDGPGCPSVREAAEGHLRRRGWGHVGMGLQLVATLSGRSRGVLHVRNLSGGGFQARVALPPHPGQGADFQPRSA